MIVSHVRYRVRDLNAEVKKWRDDGFSVEMGSMYEDSSTSAFIYFSKGPYIELEQPTAMPAFQKGIMRFLGKGFAVQTFDIWDAWDQGVRGIALESDNFTLSSLQTNMKMLRKQGLKVFAQMQNRLDLHGRMLRRYIGVVSDPRFPLLVGQFSDDPRPEHAVHPNGTTGIERIRYRIAEDLHPLVNELCNDPVLETQAGSEEITMEFVTQ